MKRLSFIVFILLVCPSLSWGAEDSQAEAQFKYATTHWDSGNLYAARQEYQKLVDLYPDSPHAPEALLRIGDSSARLYDFSRAISAYRRIISDFPDLDITEVAHLRLGNYYRDSQDYEQSRHHYRRILDNYSYTREAIIARMELLEMGQGPSPAEEEPPVRPEEEPPEGQDNFRTPAVPDDKDTVGTGSETGP